MPNLVSASPRHVGQQADAMVAFRRTAGAISLPLGFLLQAASNCVYAVITTESGLSDGNAVDGLELYGRYPNHMVAASVLAMTGVLFIVAGLPTALRVLHPFAPRLAFIAVVPMVGGYVSYFGVVTSNFATLAIAEYAASHPEADLTGVWDSSSPAALIPFFLLFVLGNLGGTLLLGIAVVLASRRSKELPWYAGALIMAWPVGHIANLIGGGEWFAVAGGVLEVVGLSILAIRAMQRSAIDRFTQELVPGQTIAI